MNDSRRIAFVVVLLVLLAGVTLWLLADDDGPVRGGGDAPVTAVGAVDDDSGREAPLDPQGREGAAARPLDVGTDVGTVADEIDEWGAPPFVRGHLTSNMNLDFSGMTVVLYDAEGGDVAWADARADGAFVIFHDAPLRGGWGVGTEAVDHDTGPALLSLLPAWSGDQADHSPDDPPVECELRVRTAPVVTGRVLDFVTGSPVEDAEISVGTNRTAFLLEDSFDETDLDGRYSVEVTGVPGDALYVSCRGWEYQAAVQGPFDIGDEDALRVDFRLAPTHVVSGTVVEAGTGRPVSMASLTLGSPLVAFEDNHTWDFTDDEGAFELEAEDLPLQGAWLHVEGLDDLGPAVVTMPAFDNAGRSAPLRVALGPLQTLHGHVTDDKGSPVADATLHLTFFQGWLGLDSGIYDQDFSDAGGAFSFALLNVPPEVGRLVVRADGYRPYSGPLTLVAQPDGDERGWTAAISLTRLVEDD